MCVCVCVATTTHTFIQLTHPFSWRRERENERFTCSQCVCHFYFFPPPLIAMCHSCTLLFFLLFSLSPSLFWWNRGTRCIVRCQWVFQLFLISSFKRSSLITCTASCCCCCCCCYLFSLFTGLTNTQTSLPGKKSLCLSPTVFDSEIYSHPHSLWLTQLIRRLIECLFFFFLYSSSSSLSPLITGKWIRSVRQVSSQRIRSD